MAISWSTNSVLSQVQLTDNTTYYLKDAEARQKIEDLQGFKFVVWDPAEKGQPLPPATADYLGKIVLVPLTTPGTDNRYAEYVLIEGSSAGTYAWEKLGEIGGVDLNLYYQKTTGISSALNASVVTAGTTNKLSASVSGGAVNKTSTNFLKTASATKSKLVTANITGISGISTNASLVQTSSAKDVAKVGTAVKYGTANVGTATTVAVAGAEVTYGNANVASSQTTVGNANVGSAVVAGQADVGEAVVAGQADVGTAISNVAIAGTEVTYGTANRASSATTVGNANVGTAVVYGKANVGTAITNVAKAGNTVYYGTADVGQEISLSGAAFSKDAIKSASCSQSFLTEVKSVPIVEMTPNGETLVFSIGSISTGITTTNAGVNITTTAATTGYAYAASSASTNKTFNAAVSAGTAHSVKGVGDTVSITPAVAAPDTQTLTPAAVSSTTIYGAVTSTNTLTPVGSKTSITPAVAATRTITPAVAATRTITPAAASTTKIYGAVASSTKLTPVGGTTNITPAVEAPSTQTLTPAVTNGTITDYTFKTVDVPKAGDEITVATGALNASGAGAEIATGISTTEGAALISAEYVEPSVTLVSGTTGDVSFIKDLTYSKPGITSTPSYTKTKVEK